jgi:uncharacterized protein
MVARSAMMLLASTLALSACRSFAQTSRAAHADCRQDYLMLTGLVVDQAALIPDVDQARLTAKLASLEQRTGHQFVIATTPSLQGKAINDYSFCLANHWGVGRKTESDGVMLLVAPMERKVRIEVGYGLEAALRDDEAALILNTDVLPAFKVGNFPRGIEAGADAIIREIS